MVTHAILKIVDMEIIYSEALQICRYIHWENKLFLANICFRFLPEGAAVVTA